MNLVFFVNRYITWGNVNNGNDLCDSAADIFYANGTEGLAITSVVLQWVVFAWWVYTTCFRETREARDDESNDGADGTSTQPKDVKASRSGYLPTLLISPSNP